jgi:hypothetical protein
VGTALILHCSKAAWSCCCKPGGVASAGSVTNSATAMTNGLFTALVNFGAGAFTGASNRLVVGTGSLTVRGFNL